MVTLNLTAMTTEEIIIKDYLENNASETLAEKINNGVQIEKDGKVLTNRKTLGKFMTDYACKEAQKQAKQGAHSVGIYKDAVFNWAVHYFEEDSIEGQLYNLDGTEYKATASVKPVSKPVTVTPKKQKPMDFFDMMAAQEQEAKLAEFEEETSPEAVTKPVVDVEPVSVQEPAVEEQPTVTKLPSFIYKFFGDVLKIEVNK